MSFIPNNVQIGNEYLLMFSMHLANLKQSKLVAINDSKKLLLEMEPKIDKTLFHLETAVNVLQSNKTSLVAQIEVSSCIAYYNEVTYLLFGTKHLSLMQKDADAADSCMKLELADVTAKVVVSRTYYQSILDNISVLHINLLALTHKLSQSKAELLSENQLTADALSSLDFQVFILIY